MPRKLRLEFEHAFYHVMNRGRGRQIIFHDERYYHAFIDLLKETHKRFACVIHCYCLMGNHYHLLIETPNANLSRIMRHINGVYTQIYNRLKKTDGSLFRGRYKSILVDKDAYILQLSRYIHRNPIDMKRPLVENLIDYEWSSYRVFDNKEKKPDWLNTDFIFDMLGHKQKYKAYKSFVQQGVDNEISDMFSGKQFPSVIGEPAFKQWVFDKLLTDEETISKSKVISNNIKMIEVIEVVSKYYNKSHEEITQLIKGPQTENEARKVAMYLCQHLSGSYLKDIAKVFNMKNVGSVSYATHKVGQKIKDEKYFRKKIDKITKSIVSQAT